MITEIQEPAAAATNIKLEFVLTQLEQAMETYRTQFSLLMQIITVLVIVDATVVGYAISAQISSILFIGALFPLTILYVLYRIYELMLPAIYTAVSLEHRYGGVDTDWLASTFVSSAISPEYVAALKAVSSIQDSTERIEQLRNTPPPAFGTSRGLIRITLILVALGQVIAPVVLSRVFSWRLF